MFHKNLHILLLLLAFASTPSFAAFPNDLDDVVFVEENPSRLVGLTNFVRNMAVTGTLNVEISGANPFGGQNVILDNSARNAWPGILGCCNANAWIVVNVEGTWYAATWEFMRVGQTTKSTIALVGPGHIRFPPLSDFRPQNGEIYGFFNSCITRNGITPDRNNCQERTDIALFRFGEGQVGFDALDPEPEPEPEPEVAPRIAPILDLLTETPALLPPS